MIGDRWPVIERRRTEVGGPINFRLFHVVSRVDQTEVQQQLGRSQSLDCASGMLLVAVGGRSQRRVWTT